MRQVAILQCSLNNTYMYEGEYFLFNTSFTLTCRKPVRAMVGRSHIDLLGKKSSMKNIQILKLKYLDFSLTNKKLGLDKSFHAKFVDHAACMGHLKIPYRDVNTYTCDTCMFSYNIVFDGLDILHRYI